MITDLINKQDSFEIVRDKIAQILADESANQVQLATDAGEPDPSLWVLNVYRERSRPWERWLNNQDDLTPVVNVWFESETAETISGDTFDKQNVRGVFNIDCIGAAVAQSTTEGHDQADKLAAFNVQRAARLVRNIIMSANYHLLDLQGTVFLRWVQSITSFQPPEKTGTVATIGLRVQLVVDFREDAPQLAGEPLELISIDITESDTGQVLAEADYTKTGGTP